MIPDVFILSIGTLISYISSRLILDGILGGMTVMIVLLLTLRIISGNGHILHPANGWIALLVFVVYAMLVIVLPRCHFDRYGSRFCRETNPYTGGVRWLAGLITTFFLMGCVIINESGLGMSHITPVGWLGFVGALVSIVGIGTVIYGMRSVPITHKETQHLYMRGAFVDTEEQSVRILPGYTSESKRQTSALLDAFDLT